MGRLVSNSIRATEFKNLHPEWADMAYEVLFRHSTSQPYDIQYAVAQALMAAFEMGQTGRYPPRPEHMGTRRFVEPPPDETVDAIYAEIKMLAWSPLTGHPRPDGHVKWSMQRHFRAQQASQEQATAPPVIRRRAVAPPAEPPKVIRRQR